jgi:hypothetical protein
VDLDGIDDNPESAKDDYDKKWKAVEQVANPIMCSMYANGAPREEMDDLRKDL